MLPLAATTVTKAIFNTEQHNTTEMNPNTNGNYSTTFRQMQFKARKIPLTYEKERSFKIVFAFLRIVELSTMVFCLDPFVYAVKEVNLQIHPQKNKPMNKIMRKKNQRTRFRLFSKFYHFYLYFYSVS